MNSIYLLTLFITLFTIVKSDSTPITGGTVSFTMKPNNVGITGNIDLAIGSGEIIHANNMITGGNVKWVGEMVISSGDKNVRITSISMDIGSGYMSADIDTSKGALFNHINTETVHVTSEAGSAVMTFIIGKYDGLIDLGNEAKNRIGSLLNIDMSQEDELITGYFGVDVIVDESLAKDLGSTLKDITDHKIDTTIDMNSVESILG